MREVAVALHRFGLGGRGDETAPGDPKAWLAAQLRAYDPSPAALAALPRTPALVTMLAEAQDTIERGDVHPKERALAMRQLRNGAATTAEKIRLAQARGRGKKP